jgi:hypothetical protein
MSEFLLLMRGDHNPDASPAELQARMGNYMEWMGQMMAEGRMVVGQPLEPRGALLHDAGTAVTDGPFLEPKEIIGGYVIVRAVDMDDAVEVARGCPLLHHCRIEVRPLVQMPGA